MKKQDPVASAAAHIGGAIAQPDDWRSATLAAVRAIIHAADSRIVEELKWRGVPVFSHGGIICTGETYKSVVKLTFARGAALPDPSRLFNASLEGNVRRAIDICQGDAIDEAALKTLIQTAVALNLAPRPKPSSKRADSKQADRR